MDGLWLQWSQDCSCLFLPNYTPYLSTTLKRDPRRGVSFSSVVGLEGEQWATLFMACNEPKLICTLSYSQTVADNWHAGATITHAYNQHTGLTGLVKYNDPRQGRIGTLALSTTGQHSLGYALMGKKMMLGAETQFLDQTFDSVTIVGARWVVHALSSMAACVSSRGDLQVTIERTIERGDRKHVIGLSAEIQNSSGQNAFGVSLSTTEGRKKR